MTLPKVSIPQFHLTIPSTKQKLLFRPYLLKEEKVLLIAVESGDPEEYVLACKQVLENCCQEDLNIGSLTTFDMEYLFLKLRAKSVNNISKLSFRDTEDEKRYDFDVDLDAIELELPDDEIKKIKSGNSTIVMKYPTIDLSSSIMTAKDTGTALDALILGCVDYIYDEETIYNDFSEEDLVKWLESQPSEAYSQMRAFFDSIPKLRHTIKYTNSKGSERTIELSSLPDFFTW